MTEKKTDEQHIEAIRAHLMSLCEMLVRMNTLQDPVFQEKVEKIKSALNDLKDENEET